MCPYLEDHHRHRPLGVACHARRDRTNTKAPCLQSGYCSMKSSRYGRMLAPAGAARTHSAAYVDAYVVRRGVPFSERTGVSSSAGNGSATFQSSSLRSCASHQTASSASLANRGISSRLWMSSCSTNRKNSSVSSSRIISGFTSANCDQD